MKETITPSTPTPKYIAYYRVSTRKQGIGLDAQRNDVMRYVNEQSGVILEEVSEKETGTEATASILGETERPGFNRALALCRKHKAILIVAKPDRISRDLSFAAYVIFHSGVTVEIPGIPKDAMTNGVMFGVYWGMAQQEAKMISERTKAALNEQKRQIEVNGYFISKSGKRITKHGRPDAEFTSDQREAAAIARKRGADNHPANMKAGAALREYFAVCTGKRNLSEAARYLNSRQLYTPRGVFHDAKSVKLLIARYSI